VTEAVLVVQDDGPGFPRQVLEQVRPGYTTKLDGHGLGLVAVIANVQRLGGRVELKNRSGTCVSAQSHQIVSNQVTLRQKGIQAT
jgi:C4-dicarboxylate-specific signal transduction histidine kinase